MSYRFTAAQSRSLHPAHLPLKAQRRLCVSAAADVRGKALVDIRLFGNQSVQESFVTQSYLCIRPLSWYLTPTV